MPATIRIGIIGCGEMGKTHAAILAQMNEVQLHAFCDIDPERAKKLLRQHGGRYATDDPQRVMRDGAVDAVYILTHHNTHSELAIAAAQNGKHVLMEKPLALTLEECYAIGDAVERSGIRFMTAFKLRYYPAVAEAKAFIPHPIVTVGQMMDARWPEDFWANDPERGGGNVLSQGCHTMDLVCYLNESQPVRIFAEGGNFTHEGVGIIDNLVATIQFENGSIASIVQGDAGATPFVSKFSFQMMDGVKTAHLHDRLKQVCLYDGRETQALQFEEESGFAQENRDFIDALLNDQMPPATHRDGLRATMMVLRAFEAVRTGQPQLLSL